MPSLRVTDLTARLRDPASSAAAWLAGAMIVNNVIALVISVVFARLLSDYGALAALISYLTILTVAGQALQVATAREGVLGRLGSGVELLGTLAHWRRRLLVATVALTVVSILARAPIADLVGVRHDSGGAWAAAVGLPAGALYLELSILRGALQAIEAYRSVGLSLIGEQSTRLVVGAMLAAAGLGIAGAYLGSLLGYALMIGYCVRELDRRLGTGPGPSTPAAAPEAVPALALGIHLRDAAVPMAGLAIVQLLQNVDLIIARHRMTDRLDSSYAVAAVAAKVLIWVAMGAGFYLVPEASRRAGAGRDPRGVLLQSILIIAVCAVPCLAIFALGAHPLLQAVFGSRRAVASASLLPLGAAFTALAITYLGVQYLLALRRRGFLVLIGAVAAAEPVLLLSASRQPGGFALLVLAIQAVGMAVVIGVATRTTAPPRRLRTAPAGLARTQATPPAAAADLAPVADQG